VHGLRCCDNKHVCKLITLYTADAYRYSAEREMSASAVLALSLVLRCVAALCETVSSGAVRHNAAKTTTRRLISASDSVRRRTDLCGVRTLTA